MTTPLQLLYLVDEDLYRLGNATSPKFDQVRPKDVHTYETKGILMVYANGKGLSLLNLQELQRRQKTLPAGCGRYRKPPCYLPVLPFALTLTAPATFFFAPLLL